MDNISNRSDNQDITPVASDSNAMACRRCGTCCTMHQAFVSPEDIRRIVAFLGITMDDWECDYDDSRWQYSDYRLIRHVNGACAFLKFKNDLASCEIHDVKPECCAKWQPGPDRRECREGIAKQVKHKPKRKSTGNNLPLE